jgi:hypothetical protein
VAVGERQWAVKTKMFEFTGLSSYWLMFTQGQYLAASYWTPQLALFKRAFNV